MLVGSCSPREDLERPDNRWTVFFPFQPIQSNMILSALVCMSASMRTAPICACCDAAFARITSVDTRRDTVVVRTAPVGACCDAFCACAAPVGACCDVAFAASFARTASVRACCAALSAPSLLVRAAALPLRALPLLLRAAMFFLCVCCVCRYVLRCCL